MEYINYATYHPYLDLGHHRYPFPVATGKAFPQGVSLGTTGLPRRTIAQRLLDLERNDFPSKYERRAELDRIRSRRRVEDFSSIPRPSPSEELRPSRPRVAYVSPWTTVLPSYTDIIYPLSRYPVRPFRQVPLSPLYERFIPIRDDQDLDPLTVEMEAEGVYQNAKKEIRTVQGAMLESLATDRVVRLCQERNRIRNQEKRIENARLAAPIYSTLESNLGTRQKVLINYHKGKTSAGASGRATPDEVIDVGKDVSTKVTVPLKRRQTLEDTTAVEDVEYTLKTSETSEQEPPNVEQVPEVENKEKEEVTKTNKKPIKEKVPLKLSIGKAKRTESIEDIEPTTITRVKTPTTPVKAPLTPTETTEPRAPSPKVTLTPEPKTPTTVKTPLTPTEPTTPIKAELTPTEPTTPSPKVPLTPEPKTPTTPIKTPLTPNEPRAPSPQVPLTPEPKTPTTPLTPTEPRAPSPQVPLTPEPKTSTTPIKAPLTRTEPRSPSPKVSLTPEPKTPTTPIKETPPTPTETKTPRTTTPKAPLTRTEPKTTPFPVQSPEPQVQETPTEEEPNKEPIEEVLPTSKEPKTPTTPIDDEPRYRTASPKISEPVTPEPITRTISEEIIKLDDVEKQEIKEDVEKETEEEAEKPTSPVTLRRLVSTVSAISDTCDPDDWIDDEAPEVDIEAESRPKVILSATDVPSVLTRGREEEEEEEEERRRTAPTTPAIQTEEASSADETGETVIDPLAKKGSMDDADLDRLSVDRASSVEMSASTNENAEAGSTLTGDNAEETLSTDGRPLSIEADSLVADDEQVLDDVLESTFNTTVYEDSRIKEDSDEVTPKYEGGD